MRSSEVKLFDKMKKRLMTVMIGSLARIEEFKDLFTEEEYEELRTSILDFGHKQIDNLLYDLEDYHISYKTTIFMPLRKEDKR